MTADAPIDRIPVFVKEGSIIPYSDEISHADEKDGKVSRICIYEGRDCSFNLYFDKGDGYDFEKGEYSLIELSYSEQDHKLSVSRSGDYPVDDSWDVEYVDRRKHIL